MSTRSLNFNVPRQPRECDPNENSLGSVKNENANAILKQDLGSLPMGNISKYTQQAKVHYQFESLFTKNHEVIFGMGSDGLLRDLFLVLDYDSIQILDFSYQLATTYNQILSKDIRINPFVFQNQKFKLKHRIEELGGDVLYLVHPHCPTGFQLSDSQIIKLAAKFKYIILDEAYEDPLKINWNFYAIPNIIQVKSFSKLGGVPGLRLGYCITINKEVKKRLKTIAALYEISVPASSYLQWICRSPGDMSYYSDMLKDTFKKLKLHATFFLMRGNFALMQPASRFKGKLYEIDGQSFTRVTLTDPANWHKLLV